MLNDVAGFFFGEPVDSMLRANPRGQNHGGELEAEAILVFEIRRGSIHCVLRKMPKPVKRLQSPSV